ncbi:MarR family winged helix-turn-helix transcriptional regulator [Rhizobium straminoryzae]|uniref:Winged helix DNA-binding protein n=1 Tax=Rhizobium straminoryzae TaxID=1387186 RepID=A0A549TBX5_9HYPH|nr:MarR family transcriptional regulator [Rhizobium straminoryzae]TRL39390.1 winged helix DNA-binding protein [Rhizobium straminoryzae]
MSNASCHCIALRKATRKLSSLYDAALAPLGINVGQFSLLRRVRRFGPVSLTDLAEYLDLDRSTVGRNTKVLERMGLLTVATGRDQREALLSLTDAGRQVVEDGAPLWDAVQGNIETRLGAERLAQLHDILNDIQTDC